MGGTLLAVAALMLALPAVTAEPGDSDIVSARRRPGSSSKVRKVSNSSKSRKISKRKTTKRSKKARKRRAKRRGGAYFTGGLGLMAVGEAPDTANLDDGMGLSLGLGYRFTNELAVEGNFLASSYDAMSTNTNNNNGNDTAADSTTLTGGTLSLKYFMPIQLPRIEGYGQAGLGYMSIDGMPGVTGDLEGAVLDIGGGIDYRFSKEFAAGARVGYSTFLGDSQQQNTDTNNVNDQFSAFSAMLTVSVEL